MRLTALIIALTWATACLQLTLASGVIYENLDLDKFLSYMNKHQQSTGEEPTTKTNFCQGCRSMVSFVTKFNSTEHSTENKSLFKNFCQLYYPASTDFRQGPCEVFVETLFLYFQKIDPVHHCDQIGACQDGDLVVYNDEDQDQLVEGTPKAKNIVCDVCEQVIEQFKKQIEDPNYIDQLHKQMDAFCDYLKVVDMDKECRQMANKYIDQAIDFVRHLDPLKYCKSIQLCSSKQVALKQKQLMISTPTLVNFHGFGLETGVELNGHLIRNIDEINPPSTYKNNKAVNEEDDDEEDDDDQHVSLTGHKTGPNCMLCKLVVKELSKMLKNNKSEEFIEDNLLKVCRLVFKKGSPSLEQCDEMVSAYTKELIELLADESDPEVVCMLITQCTYQQDNNKPSNSSSTSSRQHQLLSTQSVTTLSDTTKQPQQQPKKPLDKQIGEPIDFGDFIAKMDPEIPSNSMRTCVECKLFVRYLQETFQDENNREEFKQYLLENLCESIKEKEVKESCTKMINQYSDYFFKAVAEQLNPGTVCADLKACKKKVNSPLLIQLLPAVTNPFQTGATKVEKEDLTGFVPPAKVPLNSYRSALCDQCVDVVTKLDEYLSDHDVDHDVSVLIDQVCKKLPDQQSQDTCTMVVKTFGQKIIEALHTMDNPKQLCQEIYLC